MIARHVNLGRVVIVLGGVLTFAALTALIFASSDRPWFWTGVLAATVLGFAALLLTGRTVGGWLARRRGTDVQEGYRAGIQGAALLAAAALTLERWLAGG